MNQKHRVVVTDFLIDSLETERQVLSDVGDVVALNATSEEDLMERIGTAHALMVYHSISLTERSLKRLEDCKLIVRCGVGVDNIDLTAARKCGIPVANVPDYGTEEVADSAIGLTLAMTRGITFLNSMLQHPRGQLGWSPEHVSPLVRLREQTLGIVGLGRIGTATTLRAKALGMNVAFYDPYKQDGYDKSLGVRRVDTLDELLGQSYVVSLHCPLTNETHHLIDAETVAKMPRGSYLVNTARGGVVDTSVLPDAIASGQLAGAAIDVLPQEPPDADDPLLSAWREPNHPAHYRLIINPHAAFYSEQGLIDMRTKGAENCRRALTGEPIHNIVNQSVHFFP